MPKQPQNPVSEQLQIYRQNSNAVRKRKYRDNADYRERCKARAVAYKARNAPERETCQANLSILSTIGTPRYIEGIETQEPILTFSYPEIAVAVGDFTEVAMRKWIADGRFPKPIYRERRRVSVGPTKKLYTERQVRNILTVLSVHQREKRKLTKKDTVIISALHRCMVPYESPSSSPSSQSSSARIAPTP